MLVRTKVMESQQFLDELTEEGTQEICIISKDFNTSGLSEMIDIILQPMVTLIPHILKDSFDLLERISKTVQDNVYLGTCDTKSLYTNISYVHLLDFHHKIDGCPHCWRSEL